MKITMIATKPDEIELTLSATMTLKQWREVQLELKDSGRSPIWELHTKIRDTIIEAQERFAAKVREPE